MSDPLRPPLHTAGAAGSIVTTPASEAAPSKGWIALAAIPGVAAVATTSLAPDPTGHWVEHLSGFVLKASVILLLVGLTVALGRQRVSTPLLAVIVVMVIGVALQALGDLQVANAIWRQSGDPGTGTGYRAGHAIGARGDLIVFVTGLAFALIAGASRRISIGLAVAAGIMVVIPPPFLWPAAGALLVVLHALTTGRSLHPRSDRDNVPLTR